MRSHKIAEGLAAALVLLLAVAGVPALLIAIGGAPTSVPSLDQVQQLLFVQDQNMTVVFAVLAAIAWFCWAAFTVSTLREIAAAIATRGRGSARPLPRLEWVGRPAAQLVAAVVLVFVSAPGLISATTPRAAAAPVVATATRATPRAATHPQGGTHSAVTYADTTYTEVPHAAATDPTPGRVDAARTISSQRQPKRATYAVQRRDTLWSIAATQLGDPLRWPELAHLNPGVVGPAPDFLIKTGSTLALALAGEHSLGDGAEQVVAVNTGDTLSGIAAEHGRGDWRTIWPANQDRPEPGGAALTNPNHIEPGWTLAVPAVSPPRAPSTISPPADTQAPSAAPAGTAKAQLPHGLSSGMRSRDLPPQRLTVTAPGVKADSLKRQPTRGVVPQDSAVGPHPVNRLTPNTPNTPDIQHTPRGVGSQIGAFGAGGALLAGGVLGALLVARRRQFRNRRPGRTIATTAPELVPVEKAAVSHGRPGLASAGFLDAALRSLSAATAADLDGRLPDVVAVRHGGGQLNLRMSRVHQGPVPAPWTADESGLWWSISTEQELLVTETNASSYLAPLPTLAAVGSDSQGYSWLLDLERAGAIALTGDPARCLDLARFLAAELAVNTWSDHLSVTMVGFGQELVGMNPARLRYRCDLDAAAVALTVDAVDAVDACTNIGMDVRTGRVRDICGDTFMPHVLLVAPQLSADCDQLSDLLEIAATHQGRAALAIILAGEGMLTERASWTMHLTEAGHLIVPELGLDLTANQLPSHEALGLSKMLSQAAAAADEPMPAATGDQQWQTYCDDAGSLLPEHTLPRDAAEQWPEPMGQQWPTSLLPFPDQTYLDTGATTTDDLAALAPRVPETVRLAMQGADPTLDEDVAAWLDPDTDLPRLTLLGPVLLRAHGDLEKNRVGFYTEIVAYLATRENGATCAQFETAFNLQPARARSDIRVARNWLGVNPRTGRKHLPDALRSKSGQARGIGVYELEDVLVDADLFRRLRVRGQARGADGMADLAMALSLVSGAPFDQLRADGYEWLTEGARIDHHLVCGIVDVAHVVTSHALATGDITAARAAAQLAQLAAPYEEIPRLDLVAVRAAEGHLEESEDYLREQVCNRSDDGGAPEDLSERTQAILRQRQWLTRAG
jgi:nucleoid-associated protein YgaU